MENTTLITEKTANPAPLGLLWFGMTTILLNIHNAGFFELNSMIVGMWIFMWWLAQVIAGIQEWKKDNTFGATAFTAYGMFWLALVALWIVPNADVWVAKSGEWAVGIFLLLRGVFTWAMFIGTLKINRALQVVFWSLTVLFVLLALGDFTGIAAIKTIAWREWILCWLSAMYACVAQILNEVYGKVVLPLWVSKK